MASQQTSRVISVFVDSSVLIAAAISATGAGRELILLGLHGDVRLMLSTFVLVETQRNLTRKQPAALPMYELFAETLSSAIVDPPESFVREVARSVEPKDAPIVAAAVQARAEYLATWDRKHLLSRKERIEASFPISVVTPDRVLEVIRR
jgi:predicted nucleic acid-binding protein